MKIFKLKKYAGFTLTEVLIAVSLFTIAAVMSTRILVDVVQLEKKASVQNALYEDARTILQQLTKEVQAGTIDYEEYYSVNVIQAAVNGKIPAGGPYYGINYGAYASRFFDPGKSLAPGATVNPDDLGIECSLPDDVGEGEECEVYYNYSADFNTGKNPYSAANPTDMADGDAFCDNGIGRCGTDKNIVDELYLIDSSGTRKTIIARKKMSVDDWAIGMVRMVGQDLDQNGLVDIFSCDADYKCEDDIAKVFGAIKYPFIADDDADGKKILQDEKVTLPQSADLDDEFNVDSSQFIPITPKRSNIKSLKFIINPVEDPYKAYGEDAMQSHPSVTIILTLNLAKAVEEDYPGEFEDITIQTTVAAGVIGKLDSYPPVDDVLSTVNTASWVSEVLPNGVGK